MLILHDSPSSDLTHVQAIADISEGFSLFDYVRIDQHTLPTPASLQEQPTTEDTQETEEIMPDGSQQEGHQLQSTDVAWIGQIVEPNRNVSTVGGRLDPTILHGLQLMQSNANVQSTASVQVFDILILGQYESRQMVTPRLRPLPGARVVRLNRDDTIDMIGIPALEEHTVGGQVASSNVIGVLLNADDVPLCFAQHLFNYHVMLAGGTGSGKSNAAANLVFQAVRADKCIIIHDAKPDYGFIQNENTDPNVQHLWGIFERYGLRAQSAGDVLRIGFHERCNAEDVDIVVGFRASDFSPDMLAALFFPGNSEQNQFESFASAANNLLDQVNDPANNRRHYSVDDILDRVRARMGEEFANTEDHIHPLTGPAILRKVTTRRRGMPWLDAIGREVAGNTRNRLQRSRLDGARPMVQSLSMEHVVEGSRIIVVDYSQMDEESYALILSYFLREAQAYRRDRQPHGLVQLVDEAHRIFDNESRHSKSLERSFSRVMREGRSVDHSIILSLQNASQIPSRVMNNLNSQIVMRQNSRGEADSATQTMGREFSMQSMRLGTGQALVKTHESRAVVLAQLAPSPYELMRNDNTGPNVRDGGADENEGPTAGTENDLIENDENADSPPEPEWPAYSSYEQEEDDIPF